MCEAEGKLVAWLDRELPAEEASEVERHLEGCEECRGWVSRYEHASQAVDSYCNAVMQTKEPRRVVRWAPVLVGTLVAAAVILLAVTRTRVEPRGERARVEAQAVAGPVAEPVLGPTVATDSADAVVPSVMEPTQPRMIVHRRHSVPRGPEYPANAPPLDTAIEIAIPAEAMFPPGAMPSGVNFIADVRIAPDGSVRQVRLRQ